MQFVLKYILGTPVTRSFFFMTTTASSASSSFTCASCRVIFLNVEEQRLHYQSEWHRYNLRRKVADRPPVTEQAYHLKVQTAAVDQTATLEARQEASKSRECLACRKTFGSAAAFENHLNSKKHTENAGKYAANEKVVRIIENSNTAPVTKSLETEISLPENATDADIDAAIEKHMATSKSRLEVSDCLYCPIRFDSMEECINHMHLNHSFYIPDIDYLKDLPGLMRHLADKVSVWHVCLSCGSESRQPFPSLESVRRHMLDKGHNKIRYDDEGSADLADFFDYSNLMKNSRSVAVGVDDSTEAAELDDFVTDDEDEEFEFDDEEIDDNSLILAPDESELILPNGVRLGARAYRRYYRQNLLPYLDQESRPNALRAINAPRPDGTVVRGQHYVPSPKTLSVVEKRGIKQEHWDRKNFALKMGIKANGLQTHYREQLLQ